MQILEGIARGEQSIMEGRVMEQLEAKQRMSKRLRQYGRNPLSITFMTSPNTLH